MLPVSKRQRSDLLETVEFLKDPKQFVRLGWKMLTGVLLV
jgi:ATP-dependent Zn protease